jgi:4-hydroxy-tetrahydrodipicolinate reductase
MTDIIVNGAGGRMGSILVGKIEANPGLRLAAGVDILGTGGYFRSLKEVDCHADVIIDFSTRTAAYDVVNYAATRKIPLVICTTGYQREELKLVKAASEVIPVFMSGNMSLGIAVLMSLAKQAAAAFPDADVEIVEIHHNRKLDAPSGTAIMLADAIKEVRPQAKTVCGRQGNHVRERDEIGIQSLRYGNIPGVHEVIVSTDTQTITLKHETHDRALLAEGALSAAEFIIRQEAGLYSMQELVRQAERKIRV